ncbi:HAD family hydrolase [Dehalococcoides mccartyi]|nr:HAD family hydrolase [Dehalococcoides mccartyi]
MNNPTSEALRSVIFLDRDGTIIKDRNYLSDPSGVELIDGSVDGLLQLASAGYLLIIVTNQSGIGRGMMTIQQAEAVNRRTVELLSNFGVEIDGIYLCPHQPNDNCGCRKPEIGMIELARLDFQFEADKSWVIGDKCSDILLAENIGARSILVQQSAADSNECNATACVADLTEAAHVVISHPSFDARSRS